MARRPAGLFLAVLAAALLLSGPAQAHAVPLRAEPAPGAVVAAPPREVVLRFSEALEPAHSLLEVLDANRTVVSAPRTIDPDRVTMRAGLPRDLPYGTYTVAWRALSAVDGHSTRGLAGFLYPDPARPLTAEELRAAQGAEQVAATSPLDALLRGLAFLGAFALVGAAVLALGVAPGLLGPAERRLARAGLAGGLLGAAATLGAAVAGSAAAGAGLEAVFAGRYGLLAGARAPLLALAGACAAATARAPARARALWAAALALALGALATLSLTSHAAALPAWTAAAVAADLLHLAAGAAWIGGLLGLALALRAVPHPAWPRAAARFSGLATVCAAAVVVTGVLASALELRAPRDLWTTAYGQVLLVKLGLVGGVLALGARHRQVHVPAMVRSAGDQVAEAAEAALEGRARDPGAAARERFHRAVRAEAVLGVAVLLAAGALTALSPPPPPLEDAGPAVLELSQEQDGVNVTLLVSPAPVRVGLAAFDVFVAAGGASDAAAHNVSLRFLPPDRSLGHADVPLERIHVGHFGTEGPHFTAPGNWTVRAQVPRQGAFDVVVDFRVAVAP